MNDTPRTDSMRGFHDLDTAVDAEFSEQLQRELNAANIKIKWLEKDLSDAYAEMRKQYPVIKAVFDSSVWTKAKEAKP